MSFDLGKLFIEWRRIVPNGVPNPDNAYHLVLLKEICLAKGIERDVVDNVILALEQDDKGGLDDKEREKAKKMGLVSKGFGNWAKEKDGPTTHKVKDGKLVPVGDDGEEEEKSTTKLGGDELSTDTYAKSLKGDETDDSDTENQSRNISDENQQRIDDFNSRVEKSNLDEEGKKLAKDTIEKMSIIYDETASKDQKAKVFSSINFGVSPNREKLYLLDLKQFGGDYYKILGKGTKNTKDLVNKVNEIMELPDDGSKMSGEIEKAAKPDLGSENIRSVFVKKSGKITDEISDKNVERLMNTPPLDRIETKKFKSLFGPLGDDGMLLSPSSEHSKEYLKFSLENNVSLDNTIEVLEKYAKDGKISPKLAESVKSHKERLFNVLNSGNVPSEEASKAIDDSYAQMFDELMNENKDLAPRMLKQFAEMRLYDSEIAKGDEAYLPGDGSFPAGDKLVFEKGKAGGERVAFISVKYGKSGDVYGCAANPKALQTLHPNEEKREIQGQYMGEPGYTIAVNDNLVETKEKTKETISSLLQEMEGLQDIFNDDELDKISDAVFNTKERVNKITEEETYDGKVDWAKVQKKLKEDSVILNNNEILQKTVGEDNFKKIIGSRNGRVAKKYDFGAAHFMTGLSLANQIRTSEGFDGVSHNKQYYNKGELKTSTLKGTTDLDEWYIEFRMYRTAGRSGGGAQVSYIGPELKEKYGDSMIGHIDER